MFPFNLLTLIQVYYNVYEFKFIYDYYDVQCTIR